MTPKRITGWFLLAAALGNITFDRVSDASMGPLAILLTSAAAAAGAVLVREGRRAPKPV